MYIVNMLTAFLVLSGVALFFKIILKRNMLEGLFMAVSMIALALAISSKTGTFDYGMYFLEGLSALGVILWGIKLVRGGTARVKRTLSPAFLVLTLLFLGSIVIYYHDFIQHIDELHQWAAAVKYMIEYDKMPVGDGFVGVRTYALATSLFHLFFQRFTGYSEQGMYVSAAVFTWIGFLLPFAGYKKENWKKVLIYTGILYIALFSLYGYGSKSLYVDVPLAAWAGGLVGWWMNRPKKKTDYLVLLTGLIMLHFIKPSAGLLMTVFVLLFVVLYVLVIERGHDQKPSVMRKTAWATGILCVLVVIGSCLLLLVAASIKPYSADLVQSETSEQLSTDDSTSEQPQEWMLFEKKLPQRVSDQINLVQLSTEKIKLTMGTFLTKVTGSVLGSKSNWNLAYLTVVFMVLVLLEACGKLYGQQNRSRVLMLYSVFVAMAYAAAVLFSYIFMFTYELSIYLRSCVRYFSICAIYLFVIALVVLFQEQKAVYQAYTKYLIAGIALFFVIGINEKYVPNATALNKVNISGYEQLTETKNSIAAVDRIIGAEDKVYYLCQYSADNLGGAELYNASALYYLENRVSNYTCMPWKFTSEGCNIGLENYDISIQEFPSVLAQGGFTYVWIHTTNPYLTRELPLVLECDEVESGRLYQVEYENGAAVGLKYVQDV